MQSIDVTSRWREDWQSATVVNSTLVVDPTIRLPGFPLTKFDGGLLRLHEADEAAVDWLTTYGS